MTIRDYVYSSGERQRRRRWMNRRHPFGDNHEMIITFLLKLGCDFPILESILHSLRWRRKRLGAYNYVMNATFSEEPEYERISLFEEPERYLEECNPPLWIRTAAASGCFVRRKTQVKTVYGRKGKYGLLYDWQGKVISQKNIVGPLIPEWVKKANKDVGWASNIKN